MNKVVAILGLVVVAGYVISDASWAHRHILGPPDGQNRSLMPIERETFIGPVQRSESLSRGAEQPAWHGITLIHTDPHHLPGSKPHAPAFYRNSHAPDGAAFMFSWPFGGLTTPGNASLNQENERAGPYSR